jgi:heme O synthase-like polyprenyltransferase
MDNKLLNTFNPDTIRDDNLATMKIPVLGYEITKRQVKKSIIVFLISIVLAVILYFAFGYRLKIALLIELGIYYLFLTIGASIMVAVLSTEKKEGLYGDEKAKRRKLYKKEKGIYINERALK